MSPRTIHIIGRGIIGLSVALALHRRNWQVVLVGPKETSESATRAAVGVSSVKGHLLGVKALYKAKLEGHGFLRQWLLDLEQLVKAEIPKDFGGVYEPFSSMTEYDGISRRTYHREFTGAYAKKILNNKELAASGVANLWPNANGAFLYPSDLWFDPRAAIALMEEYLLRHGVGLIDKKVLRISSRGANRELHLEGENQGIVPISQVFLAAGAGSTDILNQSHLSLPPMQKVWGETFRLHQPEVRNGSVRLGKTNITAHHGQVSIGSTAYLLENQRMKAREDLFIPGLLVKQKSAFTAFSGARTRFRDRAPAVGPLFCPDSKLPVWVALGFYKNGLQLGPLFAQKIANWLEFGSSFQPDRSFLVDRFR